MLKDILIKTAELINRDDIINELNEANNTKSKATQNDILRMISYYNYTLEKLIENYFNIVNSQTIISDNNRKINYLNFNYQPIKILSITDNGKNVLFSEFAKYILVPKEKTAYVINYKYIPDRVTNLNDEIIIPPGVHEKTICYGIASEFLASKNQPIQAEYFNNKFMLEIFKSKTSKDRKIKKTFYL